MVFPGKGYNEIKIGDSFNSALTITETHLVQFAGLIADFNPLHVNQTFAGESRFGSRILHGVATSAIMGGPVGMYFAGTAIAYLEHNCRFLAPVRAGDTLTITWTVTQKLDKPDHGGGLVALAGVCRNQDNVIVAEADGKMLVKNNRS
ncbi:MAG: MaoC family dehydratase [Burkholderiales bacterium]